VLKRIKCVPSAETVGGADRRVLDLLRVAQPSEMSLEASTSSAQRRALASPTASRIAIATTDARLQPG